MYALYLKPRSAIVVFHKSLFLSFFMKSGNVLKRNNSNNHSLHITNSYVIFSMQSEINKGGFNGNTSS